MLNEAKTAAIGVTKAGSWFDTPEGRQYLKTVDPDQPKAREQGDRHHPRIAVVRYGYGHGNNE